MHSVCIAVCIQFLATMFFGQSRYAQSFLGPTSRCVLAGFEYGITCRIPNQHKSIIFSPHVRYHYMSFGLIVVTPHWLTISHLMLMAPPLHYSYWVLHLCHLRLSVVYVCKLATSEIEVRMDIWRTCRPLRVGVVCFGDTTSMCSVVPALSPVVHIRQKQHTSLSDWCVAASGAFARFVMSHKRTLSS